MALPVINNAFCANLVYSNGAYTLSPDVEALETPYVCSKPFVIINSNDWALLVEAADQPELDFYADSTSLFYMGMTAVVTLWAMKALVLKLIYAS